MKRLDMSIFLSMCFLIILFISGCSTVQQPTLKNAEAYLNRGIALYNQSKYDSAISDYNKAIGIDSKYASPYGNRAIAHFYLRKYDKAWDDVYKAKNIGYKVNPGFLKALREASGRQK